MVSIYHQMGRNLVCIFSKKTVSTDTEPGVGRRLDRYDRLIPEVPDGAEVRVGDVGERAVVGGQAGERALGVLHGERHPLLA